MSNLRHVLSFAHSGAESNFKLVWQNLIFFLTFLELKDEARFYLYKESGEEGGDKFKFFVKAGTSLKKLVWQNHTCTLASPHFKPVWRPRHQPKHFRGPHLRFEIMHAIQLSIILHI